MIYAVSAPYLVALASPAGEGAVDVPRPYVTSGHISTRTQGGEKVIFLVGQRSVVRRAILRAQVLLPTGACLRFYAAYTPGLWDEMPCFEAVVRMRVQEYTGTEKGGE